ncbi:MAG: rhomboid family intramembrane serine protease [Actinobacteria bacterium]|nr:rhomboid family intramembrane serine protease [Actinomycetota bacterium]
MNRFSLPDTPGDGWFRIGDKEITTTAIVTALLTVPLLAYAIRPSSIDGLDLRAEPLRDWELWRLATWPMANVPNLFVVLGIVMVYIFGREIETMLDKRRMAWMFGLTVVVPAIVGAAVALVFDFGLAVAGASIAGLGIIAAFTAAQPMARTFLNLPFWVLGAVIVALDVLRLFGARRWAELSVVVASVVVGGLAARSFGISPLEQIPSIPLPPFMVGASTGSVTRSTRGSGRPEEGEPHRRRRRWARSECAGRHGPPARQGRCGWARFADSRGAKAPRRIQQEAASALIFRPAGIRAP